MKLKSFLLAFPFFSSIVYGKIGLFLDEDYEMCSQPGNEANMHDYTHLQILVLSDTEVFLNGSLSFLHEVLIIIEKFTRGQWSLMMEKKYEDACKILRNPMDLAYRLAKTLPECPIPAGVIFYRLSIKLKD